MAFGGLDFQGFADRTQPYLDEKYAILNKQANAAQTAAQGQLASGQGFGAYYQAQAAQAPGLAGSEEALRQAQGGQIGAQADLARQEYGNLNSTPTGVGSRILQQLGGGLNSPTGGTPAFARGTAKINGKGDGKTDTQPAMLAPGEAVLNKAAAEHLGRDTISLLNAIGAHKMGLNSGMGGQSNMPQDDGGDAANGGPAPGGSAPGYSRGTEDVPTGGSVKTKKSIQTGEYDVPGYAKGTSKVPGKGKPAGGIPPALMQAILGMGGGGGMPAPGSAQPMPMQMPMMGRPPGQ